MKKFLIVDDEIGWRNHHTNVIKDIINYAQINTADSAKSAYDILLQQKDFDIIITDMQMERAFLPKYDGEWLIEQIKTFPKYNNTKVIIISAAENIRNIATKYNVEYIPKQTAITCLSAYKEIINN